MAKKATPKKEYTEEELIKIVRFGGSRLHSIDTEEQFGLTKEEVIELREDYFRAIREKNTK